MGTEHGVKVTIVVGSWGTQVAYVPADGVPRLLFDAPPTVPASDWSGAADVAHGSIAMTLPEGVHEILVSARKRHLLKIHVHGDEATLIRDTDITHSIMAGRK